jgi:hypothetical protein
VSGGIVPRFPHVGVVHGVEWSASRLGRFPPPNGTHCIGGWVSPRAGLDGVVKRKIPSHKVTKYFEKCEGQGGSLKLLFCFNADFTFTRSPPYSYTKL